MSNLTEFQAGLIEDLSREFQRLNPQKDDKPKRFGVDTISKCIEEEDAFIASLDAYNDSMKKKLKDVFLVQTEAFYEEYGDHLSLQMGSLISNNSIWHGMDALFGDNAVSPTDDIDLYLVSHTKRHDGDHDRCGGKKYFKLYVSFVLNDCFLTLDSKKKITKKKIVGLRFSTRDWLSREKGVERSTLDDLIQESSEVQQKIINLIK